MLREQFIMNGSAAGMPSLENAKGLFLCAARAPLLGELTDPIKTNGSDD